MVVVVVVEVVEVVDLKLYASKHTGTMRETQLGRVTRERTGGATSGCGML